VLTAGADGRRVDDRHQLFQVSDQQCVEQGLVGILQLAQEGVAFEIGLEAAQRLETTRNLLVQRGDIGRQQAVQVEGVAFGLGDAVPLLNCGSASNSYPLSAVVTKVAVVSAMTSAFSRGMPGRIVSLRRKGSEHETALLRKVFYSGRRRSGVSNMFFTPWNDFL